MRQRRGGEDSAYRSHEGERPSGMVVPAAAGRGQNAFFTKEKYSTFSYTFNKLKFFKRIKCRKTGWFWSSEGSNYEVVGETHGWGREGRFPGLWMPSRGLLVLSHGPVGSCRLSLESRREGTEEGAEQNCSDSFSKKDRLV